MENKFIKIVYKPSSFWLLDFARNKFENLLISNGNISLSTDDVDQ
jgi:hypothetical protein